MAIPKALEHWTRFEIIPPPAYTIELTRRGLVAIASALCNGEEGWQKGDPIFDYVTEGRQTWWLVNGVRRDYSSCGDLVWATLWLGAGATLYSDPGMRRVLQCINREEAGKYRSGYNMINLHAKVPDGTWTRFRKQAFAPPAGSALLVSEPEHVCIVHRLEYEGDGSGTLYTLDYGQFFAKDGREEHGGRAKEKRFWTAPNGTVFVGDPSKRGRPVYGWLDLALVLSALKDAAHAAGREPDPALVPPGFSPD